MGPHESRPGSERAEVQLEWRMASVPPVIPVAVIFLLVVGGILTGYFTPTEAGSVGSFAVLVYLVIRGDMNFQKFVRAVVESLRIACMILVLIATANLMGHFFAVTRTPFVVADWLESLNTGRFVVMLIIIAVYVIGGSFIEHLAFLILATPIFFPVAMKLGYDPVWFGIILAVVTMIGVVIPPLGINVFVVSGVTKEPINKIYRGVYPYVIGMTICLFIFLLFPGFPCGSPTTSCNRLNQGQCFGRYRQCVALSNTQDLEESGMNKKFLIGIRIRKLFPPRNWRNSS